MCEKMRRGGGDGECEDEECRTSQGDKKNNGIQAKRGTLAGLSPPNLMDMQDINNWNG